MCRFIYSDLENYRHYHSACSTVAIMAHVPLLIATVYRDVFGRGCSESTPPSPPQTQNSNVPLLSMNRWKLLESLDAIIVFKNTHIIIDNSFS